MDSVLAGRSGREIVVRDSRGREIPGRVLVVRPPVAGRDVVLTIDQDLQTIAEEKLAAAVDSTGARGGDMVITDPRTGEILALTSVVNGSNAALSAVNSPYEPGSTIKPFTTAALLRHGVASLSDSVNTGDGSWWTHGRWIRDVGRGGWMTLHEVISESSNVGIAKFSGRMSRAQHYTSLRDFGFGAPTGIPLPGRGCGGFCAGPSIGACCRPIPWPTGMSCRSRRCRWRWPSARSPTTGCSWSRRWCWRCATTTAGPRVSPARDRCATRCRPGSPRR